MTGKPEPADGRGPGATGPAAYGRRVNPSQIGELGSSVGPRVRILSVERLNDSRERSIRALKSLLAFVLFIVLAAGAVLLIVNA